MAQLRASRTHPVAHAQKTITKPCVRFCRSLRPLAVCQHGNAPSSPRTTQQAPQILEAQPQRASRWGLPSLQLNPKNSPKTLLLSTASAFMASGFLGSGFDLEKPGTTLEALGVLAAVVAVHEAGHFFAAKSQDVKVTNFSIGFGPPLASYQGPEVLYTLRAIPLGGYVEFADDDGSGAYAPDDPQLLRNKSIPSRALVISAGVLANLVFSLAVLFAQVETIGKAVPAFENGVRVPEFTVGSVAQKAGFQPNDIILKVGDYVVEAAPSQVTSVVTNIKAAANKEIPFTVLRGEEQLVINCTPEVAPDGKGRIGVQLAARSYINHLKPSGLGEALTMTWEDFTRLGGIVVGGLSKILGNFPQMANQVSGPVAIVAAGSDLARTDEAGLFQFAAIVNFNLAVVNILPVPGLDGGFLAFILLEAVRGGKKVDANVEKSVMASGILLLFVLGIGLVIRDTLNLF